MFGLQGKYFLSVSDILQLINTAYCSPVPSGIVLLVARGHFFFFFFKKEAGRGAESRLPSTKEKKNGSPGLKELLGHAENRPRMAWVSAVRVAGGWLWLG